MLIRPATAADVAGMTALLNAIIAIGGTTAHQRPKTEAQVLADYVQGADALTCMVAVEGGGVVGFQAVGRHEGLPAGWGDIGTFVQPGAQARGLGQALFAATRAAARDLGLIALNATIRADNRPGLAYYARIGFVDHARDADWALDDGRRVGRVSRRFDLAPGREG
ncbi:MAG: GNAT family N-acetyltransferase [Paracoccaceae bacterium]